MILERIAIMAVSLAISHGGVAWWFFGAGQDREIAQHAKEESVEQRATAAAASAAASAIASIKVTNRTIQNQVQHEISERVVYRDCSHTPEQLRRINAAITGGEPAGSGILPPSGAASGLKFWGDDR